MKQSTIKKGDIFAFKGTVWSSIDIYLGGDRWFLFYSDASPTRIKNSVYNTKGKLL